MPAFAGSRMVVKAGLFGKPKKAAPPPAKKSGFSLPSFGGTKAPAKPAPKKGGFTLGSKKAAPAKPAPKKGGFTFGSKKAAPAKKAPAKRAPAKRAPAKKASAASDEGVFSFDVPDFFRAGKYYEKADNSSKAVGAQKIVGYKGSGQKGSAPEIDAQGSKQKFGGVVYRYADKYGGNIDEYAPIFTPETRSSTGDTYKPGILGIAAWAVGFSSLLAVGGYAIYSTSALSG